MAFQNFIVLGIIPGTDIQINFQLWLAVVLVIVLVWELRRFLRSSLLATLRMRYALSKARFTNTSDITL